MKKSKLFSVYVLIHAIVLALVLGMGAAAFSMSNGLILLENPTTAIQSANSRAALVAKIEADKERTIKSIKSVVGGCEMWDSDDYYRIKTWGAATTTYYNGAINTADCYCPSGSNRVLIRTTNSSVVNVHTAADEWRSHYYSTGNPPIYPLCARKATTSSHPLLVSGNSSCYKYSCGECCCTCNEAIEEERFYNLFQMSFNHELQKSSIFSYILRNYLSPTALAAEDSAHGCGLMILHYWPNDLYQPITTTNKAWLCVKTTVNGWDNNWGLPSGGAQY